jgi:hypothetical protein
MDVLLYEFCGAGLELENEKSPQIQKDLLPEYCRYQDEGCEYARSCLDCPFLKCLYDEPRGKQRWLKVLREKEINRLYKTGRNIKEIAEIFDVSARTVKRALNNYQDGKRGE